MPDLPRLHIDIASTGKSAGQALEILLSDLTDAERGPEIERILTAAGQGEFSLEGLLLAEFDGRAVGACFFLLVGDGTAFLWPPVVPSSPMWNQEQSGASGGILATEDALLQGAWQRILSGGAWLAQSLLDPASSRPSEMLIRNGFVRVAELDYLTLELSDPNEINSSTSTAFEEDLFEIETFDAGTNSSRFARMLERTYVQSLDCAVLSGVRTGEEALESHRSTGKGSPELWWLIRQGGADAGVCLLAAHRERASWEVVYFGLAREFRGRGLGRRVMRRVEREARAAGCQQIELAVDSRNHFALAVYRSLGFRSVNRQAVHLRSARGLRSVDESTSSPP